MRKTTNPEPGDVRSPEYRRNLIRKAWAEMGIDEPKDTATYVRGLLEKSLSELPNRRA